jgi:hypothetical protein
MDHRYSVRLPLNLTVEVFKRERFLGRYITRNMDVEGVFIEMRTTELEANDVVKLVFIAPDCQHCDYTLLAGVVRVAADGAGMMLFDHEHKALDILSATDLPVQVPGRRVQGNPESTNTEECGYVITQQA